MNVKHQYNVDRDMPNYLDKLLSGSMQGTLTQRIFNAECAVCGTKNNIEMHHVRKASDIRKKIRTGNASYAQ